MHPPENLDLVPIPSPSEMAAWDKATISRGVPSLELMERAGRGVVEVLLRDPSFEVSQGIVVLAGPGNNGGDGFVVARLLK
ncbi:MAG: hypothetical protein RL417_1723, partial [Pseudomonadota bacterium]